MLYSKPLYELSFTDIDAFLRQQHGEGVTLDYKRELLPDRKGHRYELCKDVSALANSQGGLIVFGVDEVQPDRTPRLPLDGVPRKVSSQPIEEWASQVLQDGVQPRLDLEAKAFELPNDSDKCILIVRVGASPLAPHMNTLNRDNRYYGRFYRRSNYENRIAEEYEVREMLERARRLYLGVEDELARRGYADPLLPNFGDNPYTQRLVDQRSLYYSDMDPVRAQMWASFVVLPTVPAKTQGVDRKEWLRRLEPNEHRYEPVDRERFLPIGARRPILGGYVCFDSHREGGPADLIEFLRFELDGSLEFGFCPTHSYTDQSGEQVNYFYGSHLITRLWQFIGFTTAVRNRLGLVASHLLAVNLRGSGGTALTEFASGWRSPTDEAFQGFKRAPKCLESNVQIQRELVATDFEQVASASASSPPIQIREIVDEVCAAFGIEVPVLFEPETGAFNPTKQR